MWCWSDFLLLCSSAKRENFNHHSLVYHSQIARISLVSLIYLALENQRSNKNCIVTRKSFRYLHPLPKYKVVVGCFKKYLIFFSNTHVLEHYVRTNPRKRQNVQSKESYLVFCLNFEVIFFSSARSSNNTTTTYNMQDHPKVQTTSSSVEMS